MTYKDEIKREVLNHMLNKYPAGMELGELHWKSAYMTVRADCTLSTLEWKLNNMTVSR